MNTKDIILKEIKERDFVLDVYCRTINGKDYYIIVMKNWEDGISVAELYWEIQDKYPKYHFDFQCTEANDFKSENIDYLLRCAISE